MQSLANVYLLKDLSRLSGHSVHTVKFYLKLGLIKETGRSPQTRFRYFDDSTITRLAQIRSLRKQNKSLAEIQHLFTKNGSGLWAQGSGQLPPTPSPQPPAIE